jgi:hypothetical protein
MLRCMTTPGAAAFGDAAAAGDAAASAGGFALSGGLDALSKSLHRTALQVWLQP